MSLNDPSRRAFVASMIGAVGGGLLYSRHSDRTSSAGGGSGEPASSERRTPGGTEGAVETDAADPAATEAEETEPPEGESTEPGSGSGFYASEETTDLGVDLSGKPIWGSPEAPIEVYAWTDFQCPFCREWEQETLPGLVADYVEAGRIRIVFISLPYAGEDSMTAAVASQCVWGQVRPSAPDTYWRWHEAIMDEQGEENSGWAAAENLIEYTRSVRGVSADELERCLDEDRAAHEEDIRSDTEQARSMDVDGTPTFTFYNTDTEARDRIVGAQPRERFDTVIQDLEES